MHDQGHAADVTLADPDGTEGRAAGVTLAGLASSGATLAAEVRALAAQVHEFAERASALTTHHG